MEKIPLPTTLSITEGENPLKATITMEPCYPGYGTTIGNAIRRHLFTSLSGAAVVGFKIKGVQHEFSAIPNVKEDAVEISLNLKLLRLKVFTDKQVRLSLKATGEKKIYAKDIASNSDVEIINKDHYIATLTDKKSNLEIEIIVSQGRGYSPTEEREQEELEAGIIAIDSNFSPIEKVGFRVENVRVGQMTNWDKLIIDITTDGTLAPKEALHEAVKDLLDHFTFIEQKISVPQEHEDKKSETELPVEEKRKKRKSKKIEIPAIE